MICRRSVLYSVGLLLAIAGCGGFLKAKEGATGGAAKEDEKPKGHVIARAQPARQATVEETVEGLGRCEAIPDQIASLNPAVEGQVSKLLVKLGEEVKAGQPVVVLDDAMAKADVAEKTALRDGLKASLELLTSLPRPAERKANELAIATAKINVERAQRIAERLHRLRNGEISEQQLWESDQAVQQAKLAEQTAQAQLEVMMIGPRDEAIAEAKARIATADATLALSKARLDFLTIRSPIGGVLEDLTCHPGQTIAIGGTIGEVVDTRRLLALVWLPSRSAGQVKAGQSARVQPASKSEKTSAESESTAAPTPLAKVEFVGKVADPQTGNLPVHVLIENADGTLTLGEMVSVSIIIEEKPNQMLIPALALSDQGEGALFSVIRKGESVLLHPKVGSTHAGWTQVTGTDLKAGELVITEGGYNLPEGTEVELAPATEEKKEAGDETKAEGEKAQRHDKAESKGTPKEKEDTHDDEAKEKKAGAGAKEGKRS